MKSFQTSGGTVLSTNWDEVSKTDYDKLLVEWQNLYFSNENGSYDESGEHVENDWNQLRKEAIRRLIENLLMP